MLDDSHTRKNFDIKFLPVNQIPKLSFLPDQERLYLASARTLLSKIYTHFYQILAESVKYSYCFRLKTKIPWGENCTWHCGNTVWILEAIYHLNTFFELLDNIIWGRRVFFICFAQICTIDLADSFAFFNIPPLAEQGTQIFRTTAPCLCSTLDGEGSYVHWERKQSLQDKTNCTPVKWGKCLQKSSGIP